MKKLLQEYSMHIVVSLLILAGFIIASRFIGPAPPDTITIAAGSKQGAYYKYALVYQKILKRDGITLRILETGGSLDNYKKLKSDSDYPDIAFIQGGVGSGDQAMTSLGSMYFEPVWVFYPRAIGLKQLGDLRGGKIAIGDQGSGTQVLARLLLNKNKLDNKNTEYLQAGIRESADALLKGKVRAMFLVASSESPVVRELSGNPDIAVFNMSRAEAYTRIYPYLSVIRLPQGVFDFARNVPPSNVNMLATTANLAVHKNMHPALTGLMMRAVDEVHSVHGLLNTKDRFPTPEFSAFPLNKEAKHYYKYGPSFLYRYLPFWMANLIERLKIMLLPFIALLLPLFKIFPPFYRWRVRSRIYKWYSELRIVDLAVNTINQEDIDKLFSDLDRIEEEVKHVEVPLSYADELYGLRLHLEMVRRKLSDYRDNSF